MELVKEKWRKEEEITHKSTWFFGVTTNKQTNQQPADKGTESVTERLGDRERMVNLNRNTIHILVLISRPKQWQLGMIYRMVVVVGKD